MAWAGTDTVRWTTERSFMPVGTIVGRRPSRGVDVDNLKIFRQSRAAEVGERVLRNLSLQRSLDHITIDGVEIVADATVISRLKLIKKFPV
jgi:hypothetical protein